MSVIRVSGPQALEITGKIFSPASAGKLTDSTGYTLHYGTIKDGLDIVDDVIVSVYRAPRSYTGEDMAEISCHGSSYITRQIIRLLTAAGARAAAAGEFTMRAYLNGKMDLSQAEAVAGIIASEDKASHRLAMNQMKGGYSGEFRDLRERLLELVSLLELELDFSEEDVEFADRSRLTGLMGKISVRITSLAASYELGNIIKEGVPVVIAGEPNAGKSTLLNALVREDRAMVSDIAGTTRDVIEQTHIIGGVRFRFSDTAGLRESADVLENMGMERAREAVSKAKIVLYIVSPGPEGEYDIAAASGQLRELPLSADTTVFLLLNKADTLAALPDTGQIGARFVKSLAYDGMNVDFAGTLKISAKTGEGIDSLRETLSSAVDTSAVFRGETVVTSSRHLEALMLSKDALDRAQNGIEAGLSADLLAEEIRDAIYHLASIAGQEITPSDVLQSIFSRFCIGK